MATGGFGVTGGGVAGGNDGGGDDWERAQGRKDQRHCTVAEVMKEAYEEVEARGCRALAYGHQVPCL